MLFFVVGLPALGIFTRDMWVPAYLWPKEIMTVLVNRGGVVINSELFMNSLLFVHLSGLGFITCLFLKNCKRSMEEPAW